MSAVKGRRTARQQVAELVMLGPVVPFLDSLVVNHVLEIASSKPAATQCPLQALLEAQRLGVVVLVRAEELLGDRAG